MVASSTVLLCFLLVLISMAHQSYGYIPCDEVIESLMPCADYARHGGKVTDQCCSAVKQLKKVAKATEDRQQVCQCAKDYAPLVPDLNFKLIKKIPKKCGVHLSLNISPDIDCSKVK